MTTENRDIVGRCCICRYSMYENGARMSHNPVSGLAWQNIATVFTVSDGLCTVCNRAKRDQLETGRDAFRAGQAAAVGV